MTTQPDCPMLPELEFRAPDCPLCGTETNPVDGSFDCESCNLTWESDGRHGTRMAPETPQCLVQCSPHDEKLTDGTPRWKSLYGRVYTCVLEAGHGEHTDPQSHQQIPHRGVRTDVGDDWCDTHEWPVVQEATVNPDRCDPTRGHHSSPHRGCILR